MKAAWSSTDCDTKKYFKQHTITFDITLCGDWAGNAFRKFVLFRIALAKCDVSWYSSNSRSWWYRKVRGTRRRWLEL
jgi:hypothetical protein